MIQLILRKDLFLMHKIFFKSNKNTLCVSNRHLTASVEKKTCKKPSRRL